MGQWLPLEKSQDIPGNQESIEEGDGLMIEAQPKCIYCGRSSDQVPLLALRYRQAEAWICSQHLPILIHEPGQLAGRLPGAENLAPSEHHRD